MLTSRSRVLLSAAALTVGIVWMGCAGSGGVPNTGGIVLTGGVGENSFAGAGGSGGTGGIGGIGGIGGTGGTGGSTGPFTLLTTSFVPGGPIPTANASFSGQAGTGRQNISPALQWTGVPADTQDLVIVVYDGTFMHWALWGIPPTFTGLAQGLPQTDNPGPAPSMTQGANTFGTTGYGGPDPTDGLVHTYVFEIYALPSPLGLPAGTPAEDVLIAVQGFPSASFTGTFP